jgi:hypothetical protein
MALMRSEIIRGSDESPHVQVDRENSIDGRLADLIRHLDARFPLEGWSGFLDGAGSPRPTSAPGICS